MKSEKNFLLNELVLQAKDQVENPKRIDKLFISLCEFMEYEEKKGLIGTIKPAWIFGRYLYSLCKTISKERNFESKKLYELLINYMLTSYDLFNNNY